MDKPKRQKFKRYPIGVFQIEIAGVQTVEGKLFLFVGITCMINDATVKRFHCEDHNQLRTHLADFMAGDTFSGRLMTEDPRRASNPTTTSANSGHPGQIDSSSARSTRCQD